MKKITLSGVVLAGLMSFQVNAQNDSTSNEPLNSVQSIIENDSEKRLTIGAYGEVAYSQVVGDTLRRNGKMDVPRLVTFLGYKFNDRTHFVSEIEFEHVRELWVEQAFLNYRMHDLLNFRAGLILIPMGIINEYHEPSTFNGVHRPNVDKSIVPSTWREIGAGFTGKSDHLSLKYQLYVVNGFLGYSSNAAKLKGSDGLRSGRQRGAESIISTPNLSMKVDYYGIPGLKIGAASYFGSTQSDLKDKVWKDDSLDNTANNYDSSRIDVAMVGFDVRYTWKGFQARGQYVMANLGNAQNYNNFTNTSSPVGSSMYGYYFELGYNVLQNVRTTSNKLIPFVRYEKYDTHASMPSGYKENKSYDKTEITAGLGFKVADGAVFKADFQILNDENRKEKKLDPIRQVNLGIGVWF